MGIRLVIGLALLALGGCGGTSETGKTEKRVAFTVADTWYAPPPSSSVFLALDENRFASVAVGCASRLLVANLFTSA